MSCARKNYEDSQKSKETIEKEISLQEAIAEFFSGIELGVDTFKTTNGSEFTVTSVDDAHINISIPGNANIKTISLNVDDIRKMLESGKNLTVPRTLHRFSEGRNIRNSPILMIWQSTKQSRQRKAAFQKRWQSRKN